MAEDKLKSLKIRHAEIKMNTKIEISKNEFLAFFRKFILSENGGYISVNAGGLTAGFGSEQNYGNEICSSASIVDGWESATDSEIIDFFFNGKWDIKTKLSQEQEEFDATSIEYVE